MSCRNLDASFPACAGISICATLPGVLRCGFWGSNSGSRTCIISTLITEPSLQPLFLMYFKNMLVNHARLRLNEFLHVLSGNKSVTLDIMNSFDANPSRESFVAMLFKQQAGAHQGIVTLVLCYMLPHYPF